MSAFVISILLSTVFAGCAGYPTNIIDGERFRHVVIGQSKAILLDHVVHIYIEGDGQPFVTPNRVARDPSPRQSYALKLMEQDEHPAIVLGRPCYHGLVSDASCNPLYWTTQRYAPSVVNSMVAAAQKMSLGRDIVLIGYSGGGNLAMLMAPKLSNVLGVITIAANLDVKAWTQHHGYTRLTGSLNAADYLSSTLTIGQHHFAGAEDTRVPPTIIQALIPQLPENSVQIMPKFDHDCCWAKHWPRLLAEGLTGMQRNASEKATNGT